MQTGSIWVSSIQEYVLKGQQLMPSPSLLSSLTDSLYLDEANTLVLNRREIQALGSKDLSLMPMRYKGIDAKERAIKKGRKRLT